MLQHERFYDEEGIHAFIAELQSRGIAYEIKRELLHDENGTFRCTTISYLSKFKI